ncbi:SRPBCC domain-containing protein [Planctomycetota bacterium]|nr:SRPBCC domain-containing protein [Planctomycetota bacterium]
MAYTAYTIEIPFNQSCARLFQAFTTPKDMEVWCWADLGQNAKARADLRVGGFWSVYCDNAFKSERFNNDRAGCMGFYTDIQPSKRLAYTLHWDADVFYNLGKTDCPDEFISIEFIPDGDGCLLKYTHGGIPDIEVAAAEHEKGTRYTLAYLQKFLDGALDRQP